MNLTLLPYMLSWLLFIVAVGVVVVVVVLIIYYLSWQIQQV